MSNFHKLPKDLIEKILKWYQLFQQSLASQRIQDFRKNYDNEWKNILSDIRSNIPAYKVNVVNFDGLHLSIYFRLPDCDINEFNMRALFNSWEYTLERSALGLPRSLFYLSQ